VILKPNRAQSELEKFKNNFEVIQTCLGEIESLLQVPKSKLEHYQEELEEVNRRLTLIFKNRDVLTGPIVPQHHPGPIVPKHHQSETKSVEYLIHDNSALGGLVFSTTAKTPLCIVCLLVMSRYPGTWNVEVRKTTGNAFKNIESWTVVTPRSAFQFSDKSVTQVWKGEVFLKKGESVSWAVSNFGNPNGGKIVGSRKDKNIRGDENLEISLVSLLDRRKANNLYPVPYITGFIGKIDYKVL